MGKPNEPEPRGAHRTLRPLAVVAPLFGIVVLVDVALYTRHVTSGAVFYAVFITSAVALLAAMVVAFFPD